MILPLAGVASCLGKGGFIIRREDGRVRFVEILNNRFDTLLAGFGAGQRAYVAINQQNIHIGGAFQPLPCAGHTIEFVERDHVGIEDFDGFGMHFDKKGSAAKAARPA